MREKENKEHNGDGAGEGSRFAHLGLVTGLHY